MMYNHRCQQTTPHLDTTVMNLLRQSPPLTITNLPTLLYWEVIA